jgi:hypothetical protein
LRVGPLQLSVALPALFGANVNVSDEEPLLHAVKNDKQNK